MSDDLTSRLDRLRGNLPFKPPNARSIAALAENPACTRRAVVDAALVNRATLAERLGYPGPSQQSPFAIARGHQFERRMMEHGAAELISLLRNAFGFEVDNVRIERIGDLRSGDLRSTLRRRAMATRHHLKRIAEGRPGAVNILDSSVTTLEIGGVTAYLEQDALAVRAGGRLRVIEMKSFPVIDGMLDADKAGEAKRQSAVYVLSVQHELTKMDLPSELVDPRVILVCPKNFGLEPAALAIDTSAEVRALRRLLAKRENVAAILDLLPADFSLSPEEASETSVAVAVAHIPANYLPGCLSRCELGRFCREEAIRDDSPGRLGAPVRNMLGAIPTVRAAVEIAQGKGAPRPELEEAAVELRRAHLALERVPSPRRPL